MSFSWLSWFPEWRWSQIWSNTPFCSSGVVCRTWTVTLPQSIMGLSGSCITIPCRFEVPETVDKRLTLCSNQSVVWKKERSDGLSVYNGRNLYTNKIQVGFLKHLCHTEVSFWIAYWQWHHGLLLLWYNVSYYLILLYVNVFLKANKTKCDKNVNSIDINTWFCPQNEVILPRTVKVKSTLIWY